MAFKKKNSPLKHSTHSLSNTSVECSCLLQAMTAFYQLLFLLSGKWITYFAAEFQVVVNYSGSSFQDKVV